jgi:hypothetical protein
MPQNDSLGHAKTSGKPPHPLALPAQPRHLADPAGLRKIGLLKAAGVNRRGARPGCPALHLKKSIWIERVLQ